MSDNESVDMEMKEDGHHHGGRPVVLMGWSGADWAIARPLMAAGQMPCLRRCVEGGGSGTLESLPPYVPSMLWTSLATGANPDRHGVVAAVSADTQLGRLRPWTPWLQKTPSLWRILSNDGVRCGVVGWPGTYPAETICGTLVSDAFLKTSTRQGWYVDEPPRSIHPPDAAAHFEGTRVLPSELDPEVLRHFVHLTGEESELDQKAIQQLARYLAELYSAHHAALRLLELGQPTFLSVTYQLLNHVSRQFLKFHPPALGWISDKERARWGGVVTAAYRLQDLLLGDLLAHCDSDTRLILISEHGHATGADRPQLPVRGPDGIEPWKMIHGMFVLAGKGIPSGRHPRGARLTDVAPTILAMLGMTPPAWMDGRILDELWEGSADSEEPQEDRLTSRDRGRDRGGDGERDGWEDSTEVSELSAAGTDAPIGTAVVISDLDADAADDLASQHLEMLGELNHAKAKENATSPALICEYQRIQRWNTGVALHHLGKSEDALRHLHAAYLEKPELMSSAYQLALCQMSLRLSNELRRTVEILRDEAGGTLALLTLDVRLALLENDPARAWSLVATLPDAMSEHSAVKRLKRMILMHVGRFREVIPMLEETLNENPMAVTTWVGLAHARFATGDMAGTLEAARRALELHQPIAHATALEGHATARLAGRPSPSQPVKAWTDLIAGARNREEIEARLVQERQTFRQQRDASRRGVVAERPLIRPEVLHPSRAWHLIVSGPPRSGTAALLRMLAFGGLPILTDGVRGPDDDNPMGYFEWSGARRLKEQPHRIADAKDRAVKISSNDLRLLPRNRRYKVLFMCREVEEIVSSQMAVIGRRDNPPFLDPEQMRMEMTHHLDSVKNWGREAAHLDWLEIPYRELVTEPKLWIAKIVEFVGADRIKRPDSMIRAICPELYRHRGGADVKH